MQTVLARRLPGDVSTFVGLWCVAVLAVALLVVGCPGPGPVDAGSGDGDGDGDGEPPDGGADGGSPSDAGGIAGDGDGDGDVEPPPGYFAPTLSHRGNEAVLVGGPEGGAGVPGYELELAGYGATSIALSGDGAVLWVALYHELAEDPLDRYRVYSLRTDGTGGVQQSGLALPEAPAFPEGLSVTTTDDGEVAWVSQHQSTVDGVSVRFSRATRGNAFEVVAETDPVEVPLGAAQNVYARATADGLSLLYQTGRELWRIGQVDGFVPFSIGKVEDLTWNGDDLPANAVFSGLGITDNGGQWITAVKITDSPFQMAFLTGASIPTTTFEQITDAIATPTMEIDDLGERVAFADPFQMWVGTSGGVQSVVTTPVGDPIDFALSGSGQVLHAVIRSSGASPNFFQDLDSGARRKSTSDVFGVNQFVDGPLSDDGSVFAALASGVYVLRQGGGWFGADVEQVFWRWDDDGNLVVRAEITADAPVRSVTCTPILDGYYPPHLALAYEEDPVFGARFGAPLAELPGAVAVVPGATVYEGTLLLNADAALLDDRFSFRVTVAAGPAGSTNPNHTGFVDFALDGDGG